MSTSATPGEIAKGGRPRGQVGVENAEGALHLEPLPGVPRVGLGVLGQSVGGEWSRLGQAPVPPEALTEIHAQRLGGGEGGAEEALGELVGTRSRPVRVATRCFGHEP